MKEHADAAAMVSFSSRMTMPRKRRRPKPRRPELTVSLILAWADAYQERTGELPGNRSGSIPEALGDNWRRIDNALRYGLRGLPGGSSLAALLAEHRGRRNVRALPPLSEVQIAAWAEAHYQRMGAWPTIESGAVPDAPGELWRNIDMALREGGRQLPGGSSLARLLEHLGVRNRLNPPRLSNRQILAWAEVHRQRTGAWPSSQSGPIPESPPDTWAMIDHALREGLRGLSAGSSVAKLLADKGKKRNLADLPRLTRRLIVQWATAHCQRTGRWPTVESGPVEGVLDETWQTIDRALREGLRGLAGSSSLAQLLAEKGKKRNKSDLPRFTEQQIFAWAESHRERTGRWPTPKSGPIADAPGETWKAMTMALLQGHRGLPGGDSIPRLIRRQARVRKGQQPAAGRG
jgi:hypothetical protein